MSETSSIQLCPAHLTTVIVCATLVLLVSQNVRAQPTQCGTFGHELQSSQTILTNFQFYLNTQYPAPCSGNVTTWEYCYYNPNVQADEYQAAFGIYRLDGSNYQLVSQMLRIIISNTNIGSNPFTCRTLTTPSVTTIQQGDVLGACIHDVRARNDREAHLNIVGNNSIGYSIQVADTSNRRCNSGNAVSAPNSVSEDDLSSRNSTVLHLYANIVSHLSLPPSEPPTAYTTTEVTTSIPFIPSIPLTTERRPTTVAVSQTNARTLTTVSEATTEQTMSISDLDDTTTVSVGPSGTTTSDQLGTLATISDPADTIVTTSDQLGTSGVINTSTSDSSIGAVVGVIVSLLLVLIIIVTVVVLTLLVVVRRKKNESYSIKDGTTNTNALDNIMYDKFSERAELETSAYEIPMSNQQQDSAGASTELTHTYDYTSFNPYGDLVSSNPLSLSIYECPLDSAAVSFAALLQKNQRQDIYAGLQPFCPPSTQEDAIYGMIRACGIIDIPRSVVRSVGHLGSGQFANVEEGTWKKGVNKEVRIALKTMKPGTTEEDKIKFLQEAAIMAQFRHPNVIGLYGVVSKGEPVILVTELMEKGDLRHYLNSIRPDPGELPPADLPKLLLIFSQQVAHGMQYLAGKGFVHRDLAARNILVSENKICKVSDFGMSRDLADEDYYVAHGGKIPVKWTAPEALNYKKYSTASDAWSYGCLLYEIWSLGHKPFEGISNTEAMKLVESGRRLPPPPGCPRMIYQLMIQCWNPGTSPRPSFCELVLTLVGNQQLVLSIPQDSIQSHQLAGVLGAPLEAGEKMYQDLQYTYVNQGSTNDRDNEHDNDYEEFD